MNLHETEYGRRFFNSQLPSLIKALERIAENLSAPKQSLSADFVADPDFLHDLYYGDYEPSVFKTQSEHQKQLNHTSALDEENRDHLLTLLRKIYHSAGILFVSHDVSALKMLCRETVILEQGAMIERQNTEALFAHPQQAWTQAFVHAAETRKGGGWSWKAL